MARAGMAGVPKVGGVEPAIFTSGDHPFRWWVIDCAVNPIHPDIRIEPPDWPGWEARYDDEYGSAKRTARDGIRGSRGIRSGLGSVCQTLETMGGPSWTNYWCRRLGYAVIPDPLWWGGGFQVTGQGGSLAIHLDADRQPMLPHWRRALSVVSFVHPAWEREWGGELCLFEPDGETRAQTIEPMPGRLVAFECSDASYHGVRPVTGPAERLSVSIGFLSPAGPQNVREFSLFKPTRVKM